MFNFLTLITGTYQLFSPLDNNLQTGQTRLYLVNGRVLSAGFIS